MLVIVALLIAIINVSSAANRICNISDYGAVSDSNDAALNTAAFARALAACCTVDLSAASRSWPLTDDQPVVLVPRGSFLVASLDLSNCSNVELHISHGATLLASSAESDYPLVPPWPSYGIGRDVPTLMRYRPFLYARNATNLRITGNGVVDGNGELW
jgi:polygalacturonase